MEIKTTPNIVNKSLFMPQKRRGTNFYVQSFKSQTDCFEKSDKKVKKNFITNLFDRLKSLFSPKKQEKLELPKQINTPQISFKGISVKNTKNEILKEIGLEKSQAEKLLSEINENTGLDEISSMLELYGISPKEFGEEYNYQKEIFDGEEEFALSQTLENLKLYPILTEDNIFTPFKLSFGEESRITEAITSGNIGGVYDVLKGNNPDISNQFKNDQIIEQNLHAIYQKMALNNYVVINSDNLIDLGKMNGKDKKIIFPSSTGISPVKTINMDAKTLIKSNLITMELLEASKNVELPKSKKLKAITSKKIEFNPEEIRQKALKLGIDSLSTYEIHALTDCFTDEPKIVETAQKIINDTSNPTNKQLRQLLGYSEHLKKLAQPVLKGSNVKIDDHAYLRMIDRNMVSVADNQQGRLLSFPELVDVIKTAAETEMNKVSPKKEIIINGYKNGSGLKLLVNYTPDGICVIDSIM